MNPQSDQIRALIDEIDELLHGGSNSFIWRFSGDRARHQDALQRLRRYLTTMQTTLRIRNLPGGDAFSTLDGLSRRPVFRSADAANPFAIEDDEIEDGDIEDGDIEDIGVDHVIPDALMHGGGDNDHATELEVRPLGYRDSDALLGQLSLELAQLRESLVAPLQNEIQQLRQQRSLLQSEVTQLEIRRAQYHQSPEQEALLHQFIETLMGRLQERMVKQVATILQQALPQIVASQMAALPPAEAQQVQQLQKRANALLSNLDSTIQVFSQTLEQNVQAYQQSLSVGLERMHSLGRQGETMVSGLVNRLAEQMEQQTALYLQAPVQVSASVAPSSAASGLTGSGLTGSGLTGSANPFAPESEAIQRAQWEANILASSSTWQSTSSAGILPDSPAADLPLAADLREASTPVTGTPVTSTPVTGTPTHEPVLRNSSMTLPVQPTQDLDAFYSGLAANLSQANLPQANRSQAEALEAATSVEPQERGAQERGSTDTPSELGSAHAPYQSLEDALFDGIPDGELWTSPWENLPTSPTPTPAATTSPTEAQPTEAHTIHSLKDLVDRTFRDLENLNLPTPTAVMAPPSLTPASSAETVEIKKKKSPPRPRTQPLMRPPLPPLATAS